MKNVIRFNIGRADLAAKAKPNRPEQQDQKRQWSAHARRRGPQGAAPHPALTDLRGQGPRPVTRSSRR